MLVKPQTSNLAKIKVIGVGGAGGNAINNMIANYEIEGVEFIAVNTDAQSLGSNRAEVKLQIGQEITRGLGSGGNPQIGKKAAEESVDLLHEHLAGADMVFIAAGMGGGTGTGATPIIAGIAKNLGALTVAIVEKPFLFEGRKRMEVAMKGITDLQDKVDTLIVIPNQKLLEVIERNISFLDAMKKVDDVLAQAVKSISQLITQTGMINVDFADVKAIMGNSGSALMGIGSATGDDRATEATQAAINSPLLELSIKGAKGILLNIIGGKDLAMFEVDEAFRIISESVDPDAIIKWGASIDPEQKDELKVTVLATGFDAAAIVAPGSSMSSNLLDKKPVFKTTPRTNLTLKPEKPGNAMETEKIPVQTSKAGSTSEIMFEEDEEDEKSEEDLDTPAFLRRKKEY